MSEFPSLWDNVDMESGLDQLADLRFDEAQHYLQDAQKLQVGNPETIASAITAGGFWKTAVAKLSEAETTDAVISGFQKKVAEYPFTAQLERLKKKLLRRLTEKAQQYADLKLSTLEALFDYLLAEKVQDAADNLISQYCKRYPEDHRLLYLLAQAKWNNNNRPKAVGHYKAALLYHPDAAMLHRLEHPELKELAEKYPPEQVPAYAWIYGKGSFISIADTIKPLNAQHESALTAYRYLQKAHQAKSKNEDSLPYRARLKEAAPALFEAYIQMLNAK